jgi:preprotein translocase subunit SecE
VAKGGARNSTASNKNKSVKKVHKVEKKAVTNKSKQKVKRSPIDILKWILVFAGVIAGVYANKEYAAVAVGIRSAVGLVLFVVLLGMAAWTEAGQRAVAFIKASRAELRKVVWPTRPETMQTTMVVVVVVFVAAVLLWGLDSVLLWAMSWVTGQRG